MVRGRIGMNYCQTRLMKRVSTSWTQTTFNWARLLHLNNVIEKKQELFNHENFEMIAYICHKHKFEKSVLNKDLYFILVMGSIYIYINARFVSSLETDLTVRAKTEELAIKDFSSGSYSTIFAEEVRG